MFTSLLAANLWEMIGGFMMSIVSAVVLGLVILIVIWKMIDGDMPVGPGVGVIAMLVAMIGANVAAPFAWIPAVTLVSVITLTVCFPWAVDMLERAELRSMEIEQIDRAYDALARNPDNFSAKFNMARILHSHGFHGHAIAIAQAALNLLPNQVDPVRNISMREMFRTEEIQLGRWMQTYHPASEEAQPIRCTGCGQLNPLGVVVCDKCGRRYLLDIARKTDTRPRLIGKLALSFALVAALIVSSAWISAYAPPMLRGLLLGGVLLGVCGFLLWLFQVPSAMKIARRHR